jgi:hypothetical protein
MKDLSCLELEKRINFFEHQLFTTKKENNEEIEKKI